MDSSRRAAEVTFDMGTGTLSQRLKHLPCPGNPAGNIVTAVSAMYNGREVLREQALLGDSGLALGRDEGKM